MTGLGRIEQALDVAGYIPFVSNYSGALRMLIAKIQLVIGGLGLLGVGCAQAYFRVAYGSTTAQYQSSMEKVKDFKETSVDNLTHGMANFARAYVEMFGILGNLTMLAYDYIIDVKLQQRKIFPVGLVEIRPMFNEDVARGLVGYVKGGSGHAQKMSAQLAQTFHDHLKWWKKSKPLEEVDTAPASS